jgi:hypothetical protein
MKWEGATRSTEAAGRRQEREEVKRLRELERRGKEQAKLTALDQARLEVETHESRIRVLLSLHKEPLEAWSWLELVAALDACPPSRSSALELAEQLSACAELRTIDAAALDHRRADDRLALERAVAEYAASQDLRKSHREIATRVIRGDLNAWSAAIAQLRPFEELEELGVVVTAEFHSRESVHCRITVSGPEIIPQDAKTLTSTGKLSVKPMAKGRFHEIYQDYVCGCVLRTASEMFGFLPVEAVLVTASVGFVEPATGLLGIRPVLSVGFNRAAFSQLALDMVDPSDAIDGFVHRGDAKASRKTGAFVTVEPLGIADLRLPRRRSNRFEDALDQARRARADIRTDANALAARLRRAHPPSSPEA